MSTRAPGLPTSTVSVCVTEDEGALVRDAAHAQDLTVSSWAQTRCNMAMATPATRGATRVVARRIEGADVPRGLRKHRVSMVMRVADHAMLKQHAADLGLTVHAFVQAALLDAAERELEGLPAPQRRILEHQRRAEQVHASMLVNVPEDLADADAGEVSDVMRRLLAATGAKVRLAGGADIAEGAARMAARCAEGRMTTVRMQVPEFDVRALSHVLDVPPASLATALCVKAARAVAASHAH